MTYIEFLTNLLCKTKIGEPIYISTLASQLANNFQLSLDKAKLATSVAMKRILEGNKVSNLRFYQKGIYYLCEQTPFGYTDIDKKQIILDKYISEDNGYITGLSFLNQIGLSTQIPNQVYISTNEAKYCQREDKKFRVRIIPPKVSINSSNKLYLQLLDAFELIDKAPIDSENPYQVLSNYIVVNNLDYEKLLGIAIKYYSKNTLIQIAKTAEAGGKY